jgi:hypothetical protein
MEPERQHEHWPAVTVVARIVDVLQAGSNIDSAPRVSGVIGLDNVLAGIVSER